MAPDPRIDRAIRDAFAGVALGDGVSLGQARAFDRGEPLAGLELARARRAEITDDWTRIPAVALRDDPCIAHLDAAGFRYYVPALMLDTLAHYDPSAPAVIGLLQALHRKGQGHRYALLSPAQCSAIAAFLAVLPARVPLDREDATVVARALRDHWGRFLHP